MMAKSLTHSLLARILESKARGDHAQFVTQQNLTNNLGCIG